MPRKNPFSPAPGLLELNPASFPRLYHADQENDAAAANRAGGGEAGSSDADMDATAKPRRTRRSKAAVKLEYEEETKAPQQTAAEPTVKLEADPNVKDEESSNADSGSAGGVKKEEPTEAPSASSAVSRNHKEPPPAELENST